MKLCQALLVRHPHVCLQSVQVSHYRLYDSEGTPDVRAWLCYNCAQREIENGWDWRKEEPVEKLHEERTR